MARFLRSIEDFTARHEDICRVRAAGFAFLLSLRDEQTFFAQRAVAWMKCNVIQESRIPLPLHPGYNAAKPTDVQYSLAREG